MQEAIGQELKIIRIRKNLSLEEVAKSLNLNAETIRRYENNSAGLSVERLESILNLYNVNMSIFFNAVCENMHIFNSKIE